MQTWVKAMREFFGFREGKGAADFAAELKALSPAEKLEFWEMLQSVSPCKKPGEM